MDYLKIVNYILETSLVGSLLVVLILALRLLIKNHMKKSIVYYLWFILILKLLIPFSPESKFSIYNFVNINTEESLILEGKNIQNQTDNKPISDISIMPNLNSLEINDKTDYEKNEDGDAVSKNLNNSITESGKNNFQFKQILFAIWLITFSIILIKIITSYIKFQMNLLREYKKYNNYDLNISIEEEIKLLSINNKLNKLKIRISNGIGSPCICGILNPKILIPLKLASNINEKEKKYIILHELCHYKRKDVFITWLSSFIKAIHWFNPIIYLALNIMRSDCEEACDEMVLSKLNNNENRDYGNAVLNVLQYVNIKSHEPGTTSMITDKKKLKERIRSISKNKKFSFKTVLVGGVIIIALGVVGLTSNISSKHIDEIDKNKVTSINIKVMPSPTKQKVISKKEDIDKIVKYLNSIKIKDKKQELYKGWEVAISISGKEKYDISFIGEYINVNGIEYKVSKDEMKKLRRLYNSLKYEEQDLKDTKKENEENKNSNQKGYQEFVDKVNSDNYKIIINSSFGGFISLPSNIDTSSVLYDGFNKSKENGYDLTPYLGKPAEAYSFSLDIVDGLQEVVGIICEDKLVAYWLSPIFTSKGDNEINKILETLKYEKAEEGISYNYIIKRLISNGIKVEEISKELSKTKDGGYSAELYNIKINGDNATIYEYSDEKAALSEISLFNDDDYYEVNYSDENIVIDIGQLTSSKNVYLRDNVIFLYNGDSNEVKDELTLSLGEALKKQPKDQIVISEQDLFLRYPSQWLNLKEPNEVIIGNESYKIDTRFIKQYKNICEVPIKRDDLLYRIRRFDDESLYINWDDKIIKDKIIKTKIPRDEFIRVVKIKNGYIDAGKVYPEIEIDTDDKTLIGKKLFEEYIKIHTTNWLFNLNNDLGKKSEITVADSKVYDVILSEDGKNIFTVSISYDIKLAKEGKGWIAGTGVIDGDWIREKCNMVDIEKTDKNRYRIVGIYN
ncbi:MAG: M56 family metallopeptidase [Clostridium sp.]|nr:M56 family metallopeptidase [Clostridium sp.]